MNNTPTLIPAYGRDYASMAAVEKDWEAGKDFVIVVSGQYCSKRDFKPGEQVCICYARLRKVMFITVKGE